MADIKYDIANLLDNPSNINFKNPIFTTFDNVQPTKTQLNLELFDNPLDISSWASGISSDGIPIAKDTVKARRGEEETSIPTVNNTEEVLLTQENVPQETSTQEQKTSTKQSYKGKTKWQEELTQAYKRYGLSDNAIRNLIAKNALESNWGKSTGGKYNYGNITAGYGWKGKTTLGNDKDAEGKPIKQIWREYSSIDDYVKDEIDLLKRLYDFNENDPIEVFAYKLKHGRGGRQYAAAKNYESAISNIYKQVQV